MSDDRPLGYWDDLETAQDVLMDVLRDGCGAEWTLRGACCTGAADGGDTLFMLVLRHRLGDAGLVCRLGYAVVDLTEPADPLGWTDNYVDMRLQGSLPQALDVLLGGESLGCTQEPPALDARDGSLEQEADVLTTPLGEQAHQPQQEAKSTPEGMVECRRCGQPVQESQATAMGGELGDVWVHSGGCPQ